MTALHFMAKTLHIRPDIYGKIGNSGVCIATVDDAKKLYSGFNLCDAKTSVSMTINGPAPIILAFFMNAAIDQQCEKYIEANDQWSIVNKKINENSSIFLNHHITIHLHHGKITGRK